MFLAKYVNLQDTLERRLFFTLLKINHLESSPILIIPYCILVTYVSFMFDVGNVRQSQQLLVQICSSFKYDMKEKQ